MDVLEVALTGGPGARESYASRRRGGDVGRICSFVFAAALVGGRPHQDRPEARSWCWRTCVCEWPGVFALTRGSENASDVMRAGPWASTASGREHTEHNTESGAVWRCCCCGRRRPAAQPSSSSCIYSADFGTRSSPARRERQYVSERALWRLLMANE